MSSTVGQKLQTAREMRGLTLEDVSHETRIPVVRLQELEHDIFTSSGGLTYARSFLKHYSEFLNVDASEVISRLPIPPLGGQQDYRYLLSNFGPWIHARRISTQLKNSFVQNRSFTATLIVCSTILLLGIGVLLGNAFFQEPESETVQKAVPVTLDDFNSSVTAKKDWASSEATTDELLELHSADQISAQSNAPLAEFVPPKALPVEDEEFMTEVKKRK